ncbi:BirA family transcriptional regulator, biotin operon repressor / biotin-[acetyl-CoA-carboxylase] ligase [Gracilibacillus ureilyticus]|uniref:Bifunctional ligase/repressor BirA n=1 Tax=Gracilibacillus ureilyticus TaxID=531814 RepID=A0A1H9LMT1_9BACI|nr:biotin--[acetyl-CoA-carboxylase] ligase [Gracilibacillus ureilyticus]SER12710.1 BirA family transcriptional regulator, biotin operon repressor / biotin-[acetyl-CoA-carboxylase] ligase [Gracilibacillus ureilyticus]
MKETKRDQLIDILAQCDEGFISGQELSRKLEISRTAVWKHINELKKDGYQFEAVPKKGYRLLSHPLAVNETTLKWDLQTKWLGQKLVFKDEVDSTQDIAHQLAREGAENGTTIIANKQLKGRGRLNRKWVSHHDDGIWMSMIIRPEMAPYHASQMTLFTATSLVDTIRKFADLPIKIKWPNDLFMDGKKFCGILTEMQAELDHIEYMIIGIGLNVNQEINLFPEEIQNKTTSLAAQTQYKWDRIRLIQQLLADFETNYQEFQACGFSYVKDKWTSNAYKLGERVYIKMPKKSFEATIEGITDDGALLVNTADNIVEKIYSAEIHW